MAEGTRSRIPLTFPRFDGVDPAGWIFKAKRFFDFHDVPDHQRLLISSFYMDGAALRWLQGIHSTTPFSTWTVFCQSLETMFGEQQQFFLKNFRLLHAIDAKLHRPVPRLTGSSSSVATIQLPLTITNPPPTEFVITNLPPTDSVFFTNDNTADDGNRTTIPVLQPLPDNFPQLQPNGHLIHKKNVILGLGHTTIDAGDDKDDTIVGDTRHTGPEIINSMSLAVGLPDEDGRLSMDFTRFISEIDSAVGTIAASPGQQSASAVTLPIPIKKPTPTEMHRRRPRCKSRQLYLLEYDREDDGTAYKALLKGWGSARVILQKSPPTEFNHQEGSKSPQQKYLLVQAAPLVDGSITYTNASWIFHLIPPWPPPMIVCYHLNSWFPWIPAWPPPEIVPQQRSGAPSSMAPPESSPIKALSKGGRKENREDGRLQIPLHCWCNRRTEMQCQ